MLLDHHGSMLLSVCSARSMPLEQPPVHMKGRSMLASCGSLAACFLAFAIFLQLRGGTGRQGHAPAPELLPLRGCMRVEQPLPPDSGSHE